MTYVREEFPNGEGFYEECSERVYALNGEGFYDECSERCML
jgi:hypothetical protein